MTRRSAITSIMALVAFLASFAQSASKPEGLTAAHCFSVAPTTIFDMLDFNERLDMLDYFHADLQRPTPNSLGGDCYIVSESDNSLTFVGGNGILYQLFVLEPNSTSPIIGLIETVNTPIPDSTVRFFDSRWHQLNGIMPSTSLADWVKRSNIKSIKDVEEALPFLMISYSYDDANGTLTATNNMGQYFSSSDTPKAITYLNDNLSYKWDGKKFKPSK